MTDPITTPAQMREAAALLPCPFCGGEAETVTGPVPRKWGVLCRDCDAWRDDRCDTEAEAIEAWNRRSLPVAEPEPLAVQARAEALDALLADDEMCLRLAEGYDREDAAQRGEPTPHTMGEDGYAELAADRIACAKEWLRAIRALMEKPE